MRAPSFGLVALVLGMSALVSSRVDAQGYEPPSEPTDAAPVPEPRPSWWSDTPPRLETPLPPGWRRSRARALGTLVPGLLLLDASALLGMLAGVAANPICISLGFDDYGGYDDSSSCAGDDQLAAGLGVASGVAGAFGIGVTIAGGTRLHRVRAARRLWESTLHVSIGSPSDGDAPTRLVYRMLF